MSTTWAMIIVGTVVATTCVVGLLIPADQRGTKASARTEAINNARQIGLALQEFDHDYGEFPSARTLPEVAKLDPAIATRGTASSNALFAQLIAHGVQTEEIFHCHHPTANRGRRPDGVHSPIARALEPGECSYSYVTGLDSGVNPALPVVCAPMFPGTRQFDPGTFHGKALVLRVDHSIEFTLIRASDQRVSIGKGRTLFETGLSTVWGTTLTPDLRHPEH